MELMLATQREALPFWKDPRGWLRQQNLGRGYWVFFSAALFFDAGFSIYFFLFNLYLLDYHLNERSMGWIGGAMTFGSVVGTLPAGALTQKFGLRPLLIFLFVAAPVLNATRAIWIGQSAQMALAFLTGLAMSCWGVCFLPAVARLTTEKNRTAGFTLIFSVGVGTSILGGIVCGYLRQWLQLAGIALQPVEVKRLILLFSCAVALLGLIPVMRLRLPQSAGETVRWGWLQAWKLTPFLRRFLPLMALWSAVLAAFTPFANVYLSRDMHVRMTQIGLIFSAAQLVQLCAGALTPVLMRSLGLIRGIATTQIVAALVLGLLAAAQNATTAVGLYLVFSAAQWMSSPGLYNLLMDRTIDSQRSAAAAMTLFCNALVASAATAAAGALFTRFGYPPVLFSLALTALAIALTFVLLLGPSRAIAQP